MLDILERRMVILQRWVETVQAEIETLSHTSDGVQLEQLLATMERLINALEHLALQIYTAKRPTKKPLH